MLTAWFELNQKDSTANEYLYTQIPQHFVFNPKQCKWNRRQRNHRSVQRLYSVNPKDEDRFFLRLLLLHVPGAKSYDDLKTVNGVICNTYKEACQNLNLLDDDNMWEETLDEAALVKMPRQMRQMFATLIVMNSPQDPLRLWNKYKKHLIEDYSRTFPTSQAEQRALQHIERILQQHSKQIYMTS